MKLAVIYESVTGNTKQAAAWIAEGMNEIEGVDARCFPIEEVDEAFVHLYGTQRRAAAGPDIEI